MFRILKLIIFGLFIIALFLISGPSEMPIQQANYYEMHALVMDVDTFVTFSVTWFKLIYIAMVACGIIIKIRTAFCLERIRDYFRSIVFILKMRNLLMPVMFQSKLLGNL